LYVKIATGEFHDPLVYDLLAGLGYRPNPKRQTRVRVKEAEISNGYNPPYESLGRNYRKFIANHRRFGEILRNDLVKLHYDAKGDMEYGYNPYQRYRRYFNWKEVFAAKGQKQENPEAQTKEWPGYSMSYPWL
jgi:hypothetical protein